VVSKSRTTTVSALGTLKLSSEFVPQGLIS
jgi:hypothetical protein